MSRRVLLFGFEKLHRALRSKPLTTPMWNGVWHVSDVIGLLVHSPRSRKDLAKSANCVNSPIITRLLCQLLGYKYILEVGWNKAGNWCDRKETVPFGDLFPVPPRSIMLCQWNAAGVTWSCLRLIIINLHAISINWFIQASAVTTCWLCFIHSVITYLADTKHFISQDRGVHK